MSKKQGPEAKLKAYTVKKLKESGLLWWRNQSAMVPIGEGPNKRFMHAGTPGLPDLMFIGNDGHLWCLELKSPTGKPSPKQREFADRVREQQDPLAPSVFVFFANQESDVHSIITAAVTGAYINDGDYQMLPKPRKRKATSDV